LQWFTTELRSHRTRGRLPSRNSTRWLYIPILDLTFNGPARTDTRFHTVEINRQYDGFSDFPLYPLNVISLSNALLGIVYVRCTAST
jgi:PE-PPE domain